MHKCLPCEAKKLYPIAREISLSDDFNLPIDLIKEKFPEIVKENGAIDLDAFLSILLVLVNSQHIQLIELRKLLEEKQ